MVYIHTAFSICPSVSAKNRSGFHCGNRGGSFTLWVLFQALTQSLAGVLDSSLGGCQNYRALGRMIVRFYRSTSVFIFVQILLQKYFLFDCDPVLQNLIDCIGKQRMSSRIPLFLQLLQILLRPIQSVFVVLFHKESFHTHGLKLWEHHLQVFEHTKTARSISAQNRICMVFPATAASFSKSFFFCGLRKPP